jgi:hypothetical protein
MTGPHRDPDRLAAATEADRRAQLSGGLTAVVCGHCAGTVRARMHGRTQLAVQWSPEAVGRCREHTARDGCPYLRLAVAEAVADGRLPAAGSAGCSTHPAAGLPGGLVCPGG